MILPIDQMIADAERLVAQNQWGPISETLAKDVCCHIKALAAEHERLRKKLPETADGVPVVPDMVLWTLFGKTIVSWTVWWMSSGSVTLIGDDGAHCNVRFESVYSTLEAAEKAK